ncbi:DNA translocase FtsK 4TM domain-containing protein, partial [Wolbachia endosymbiont of Pentidionis agamae]|uniref:DNA translocase FtsK 4TM domain-containing protein n=1 Tax=Wolbachia endosymbiont of Pentidionis agamae TaxID=3110435 RepID=UPI002FD4825C
MLSLNIKKYLISLIYLLILTYICTSVFSYNYKDPSFNTLTDEKVTNLGGVVGSYIADILVQFLGLSSITAATTIFYLLVFKPKKILLKIFYLILMNFGICAFLPRISIDLIAKYRYGGIIGNILADNIPLYIVITSTLTGLIWLIGWKRTANFLFFILKKTTLSLILFLVKIFLFFILKTLKSTISSIHHIKPLVTIEKK